MEKHSHIFKVVAIYTTPTPKDLHVNLLLIQNHHIDEDEVTSEEEWTPLSFHYVLIKDLSRLVSSRVSRRHRKIHECQRCLHTFKTLQQLQSHGTDCLHTCRISLPKGLRNKNGHRDDEITSRNYKPTEYVPFIVFADFECLLKPTEGEQGRTRGPSMSISHSVQATTFNAHSMRPILNTMATAVRVQQPGLPMNWSSWHDEYKNSTITPYPCKPPTKSSSSSKQRNSVLL